MIVETRRFRNHAHPDARRNPVLLSGMREDPGFSGRRSGTHPQRPHAESVHDLRVQVVRSQTQESAGGAGAY